MPATPQHHPRGHQPAGAEAADQTAREGRDEDHRHGDRQDHQAADDRASGRARPAGTEAGRTSPPSRRRPGRRRRRWRRSRGRCGRGRSRRSGRAIRRSIQPEGEQGGDARRAARQATVTRRPRRRDWTSARTTAVRPTLSAARPGQSILGPRARIGRLGRGVGDDRDPERRDRQVDPEDHPPVDFDQEAAGERPDRQRDRRDRGPDPQRPRLLARPGRRCRPGPARA